MGGWKSGWMEAVLNIAYINQKLFFKTKTFKNVAKYSN
jgi:hypothetical protein